MKNRTDLLNYLVQKHGLQYYLELGIQNKAQNYDKVKALYKTCVDIDPAAGADFTMSTDEFFLKYDPDDSKQKFDLIFIDASHEADQVQQDFLNSRKWLSLNGIIVLHDVNPRLKEHTIIPRPSKTGHWNGDVWRFAAQFFNYEDIDIFTVDIDNGCMVFMNAQSVLVCEPITMEFEGFAKNRESILNLISWDEFANL